MSIIATKSLSQSLSIQKNLGFQINFLSHSQSFSFTSSLSATPLGMNETVKYSGRQQKAERLAYPLLRSSGCEHEMQEMTGLIFNGTTLLRNAK